MVELAWTEAALMDLDQGAEYIALDNPLVVSNYVKKVFKCVDRLELYPNSGKHPSELPDSPYREVVVPPCRIFYRIEDNCVYIVHVMRSERLLRSLPLAGRVCCEGILAIPSSMNTAFICGSVNLICDMYRKSSFLYTLLECVVN